VGHPVSRRSTKRLARKLWARVTTAIEAHHIIAPRPCPVMHRASAGGGPWWVPWCTVCGPVDGDCCTELYEVAERHTNTADHRAELASAFSRACAAISPTSKGQT
jgi:hypothetical protein